MAPQFPPASRADFATMTVDFDPISQLRTLARAASAGASLQRLDRLCISSPDPRFIGAIVSFISSRECAGILSEWSQDIPHAAGLDRLARACWLHPALINALQPFGPDQLVKVRFRKKVDEQYLASMAASRRTLPADETAAWIQRLRIYILIRSLDALDSSVTREQHLLVVSRTLRTVAENTGHPQHDWTQRLVGYARGYFEFQAETTIKCRAALLVSDASAGHTFYQALLAILESRPWIALPAKGAVPVTDPLEPYIYEQSDRTWLSLLASLDEQPSGKEANFGDIDGDGTGFATQRTSKEDSHAKRKYRGDGLRLEDVENSLFLRHSWHQLTAIEEALLLQRVEMLLKEATLEDRFGAAVTLIAVLTSQTMHDVSKLSLTSQPTVDWHLDLQGGRLVRQSPRFARRWRSQATASETQNWVHPLAQNWIYKLEPLVCKPIRAAQATVPDAPTLGELWSKISSVRTLATWFNTRFTDCPGLARLTSPGVANAVAIQVFENTLDHALAKLVASDQRSALPAACAYGAYRSPDVRRALGNYVAPGLASLIAPIVNVDLNCAGSELDLRLPILSSAIADLVKRVNGAALASSWVEHHNLLTALTILALLASTGSRPVNSPFQSLDWINFEQKLLYVEDKTAGPTQGSRICVLSDYAHELLQTHYLPHLRRFAQSLRLVAPTFAAELGKVLAADPEASLPLFLFVRAEPDFDWMEVSESQLDVVCSFGWPLPWNLFRHLNSTQLRYWGLHPEIRDALLGHADRDAESHGDFSLRVPADDMETARPLINKLQTDLGFTPLAPNVGPQISSNLAVSKSINQLDRRFGRQARADRRQLTHNAARQLAAQEIEMALKGRTVDLLGADELDLIACQMLRRADGMPHVMGSVRYEVFEELLAMQWQKRGKHATLRRRYVLTLPGRQLFTEDVVHAQERLDQFSAAFESFVAGRPRKDERPVMAGVLASIDLILYSNVAHFPALCSLLCNQHRIELVRFAGKFWFEWSYGDKWQDGKPVFRVAVTDRAAHWISLARSGKSYTTVPALPLAFTALSATLGRDRLDLAGLVRHLVQLRNQANSLKLPGIYASYLSARRPSAALPHADWIRVMTASAPTQAPGLMRAPTDSGLDPTDEAEHFFRSHHRAATVVEGTALQRCKTLFDAIKNALRSQLSNQKIAAQIAREVKKSGFDRGDAPFLLAHFATHLLTRKPKTGSRETLRASTAGRYWDSLAPAFRDAISDTNLIDMEEDELTELYTRVIKFWVPPTQEETEPDTVNRTVESDNAGDETGADAVVEVGSDAGADAQFDTSANTSDAPMRALVQLREFHDFISATYGLEDPNWTEISPDITVGVGRPGLVLLNEYLAVLNLQLGTQAIGDLDETVLSNAFVLIVCARFGLRIGEAVGLQRSDWLDSAGTTTVLVRSNWTRALKTTRSRRQVPLIEVLTALEQEVIDKVLWHWVHRKLTPDTPLLAGISRESFRRMKNLIGASLIADIKWVTRHDGSTVHMLRHSFGMRVLSILLSVRLDPGVVLTPLLVESTRRLLLASSQTDRRTLWAVARLLGHANPAMTLRAYINCLYFWLPAPATDAAVPSPLPPLRAINLDAIDLDPAYLCAQRSSEIRPEASVEPLFLRYLRYLRLLVIGQTELKAAENANLSLQEAQALGAQLAKASVRLTADDKRFAGYKLLSGVSVTRMNKLVEMAQASTPNPKPLCELMDWVHTIGPSRQILLFEQAQLEFFKAFLTALNLTPKDLWLVKGAKLQAWLANMIEAAGLQEHLHGRLEVSRRFQLDVARFDKAPWGPADRVAAIVLEEGKLRNSFELLLLWTVWHTVTAATRTTDANAPVASSPLAQ